MKRAKFDEHDAENSTTAYALSMAFVAKSVLQSAGIYLDYNSPYYPKWKKSP